MKSSLVSDKNFINLQYLMLYPNTGMEVLKRKVHNLKNENTWANHSYKTRKFCDLKMKIYFLNFIEYEFVENTSKEIVNQFASVQQRNQLNPLDYQSAHMIVP